MTATALFAVALLAPGVPLALVLRRRDDGTAIAYGELLAEGAVLGLGWWLVLGLAVAQLGDLGPATLLGPTAALTGMALVAARPALGRLPRPRPTWVGAAVAAVVLGAAWLRRDPFYLLYQTTDMSEYIRAGNELADGGAFSGWFVRLFQVPLALSSVALGRDDTVAVLPLLGLLVPTLAASIVARLGFPAVVALPVLALAAVDPMAVWFSRFPASETLYAVLLLGLLLLLLVAVQRGSRPEAVLAGGMAALLMLTRGNAVLLVPVVLVALPLCALLVPRAQLRVLSTFTVAAGASLYAGFVYNSEFQRAYFVEDQLTRFVPERWMGLVDSFDRTPVALLGAAGTAAVLAAVVGASLLVARLPAGRWRAAVLPAVAVPMVAVLVGRFDPTAVVDGVGRFGLALAALGVGGGLVVAFGVTRLGAGARAVAVLCLLLAGTYALLHAGRIDEARAAPYHLYWDRYLFSEVFPALVVLGAWGVDAARRALERVPAVAAVVLLAGALVGGTGQAWAAAEPARERELFDGAYEQVAGLEHLLDDRSLPIAYSGLPTAQLQERRWFHANTFRVFATPLVETFGRRLLDPFPPGLDPDPVLDVGDVRRRLRAVDEPAAYLVAVRQLDGSPRMAPDRASAGPVVERVGSMPFTIPVLDRRPDRADERWTVHEVTVDVLRVER